MPVIDETTASLVITGDGKDVVEGWKKQGCSEWKTVAGTAARWLLPLATENKYGIIDRDNEVELKSKNSLVSRGLQLGPRRCIMVE